VGDIGRRVCEAMAGYREHRPGEEPEALGLPGDRFVEVCSQSFLAAEGGLSGATAEAVEPNAEEREPRGDLPDALMRRWLSGGIEERRDWSRLRSWALAGHWHTLARLGVGIDFWSFESEAVPQTLDLVAEGLGRGLLERDGDGAIVRRTGRSEYATMVLLRGDGLPTEHARLLGAYDRILDQLGPEETFVELAGDEWEPPASALRELLAALRPGPRNEAHVRIFHGLVTRSGGKIGSSGGEAPWIDDLLDEVVECGGVAALGEEARGAANRTELADLIVRGTFLCAPLARPLRFDRARLLEACSTPGWTIARAWVRALLAQRADSDLAPLPRTLLARSQQHSRSLRRAVEHLDPTGLAMHLLELAKACLAAPSPGPAAAPALRRTLVALGFHLAPGNECSVDLYDGKRSTRGVPLTPMPGPLRGLRPKT
jgi:arginyl-tRNA synthetase